MEYIPITSLKHPKTMVECSISSVAVESDETEPILSSVPKIAHACERAQPDKAASILLLTSRQKQVQRYKVFESFKDPDCRCILVATDIAARGLDFPNVNLVVHSQTPRSIESMVHRSGRTARGVNGGGEVVFLVQEDENAHFSKLSSEVFPDAASLLEVQVPHSSAEWITSSRICAAANELETMLHRQRKLAKEQTSRKRMADTAELVDSDLEVELRESAEVTEATTRRIKDLQRQLSSLLS